VGSVRVALEGGVLKVKGPSGKVVAVPSMQHPDFQHILERGWVSPPSFGPRGDLRIYSAAHPAPPESRVWFASADWRRGRIQVDRRGAISDIAMEPYGGGKGKVRGTGVEVVIDYTRRTVSLTVSEEHSALGTWDEKALTLEADAGSDRVVDAAVGCALFLWCARPEAFRVQSKPPFP
jgi:hypothetical protein